VIATVDAAGRVVIWNRGRRQEPTIEAGPLNKSPEAGWDQTRFDTGYTMKFSPDGTRLAVLGPANLSMWTWETGTLLWNMTVDPVDGEIPELSRDRVLVTVCDERGRGVTLGSLRKCYDSTARIWDFNGREVRRLDAGQSDETIIEQARFNPRGNRVITIGSDGATRLWDADGNHVADFRTGIRRAAFVPSGLHMASIGTIGKAHLWETWDDLDAMIAEAQRRSKGLQRATGFKPD
jgi:WD40 repeat protein